TAPESAEPDDREVLGRLQRELLIGESEGPQRMPAGELGPAAVGGDQGNRKGVLRHLEPLLPPDGPRPPGGRARQPPPPPPQRPAQTSTHARPQPARAARGSSRSAHPPCSSASGRRASSLRPSAASVPTSAKVAS